MIFNQSQAHLLDEAEKWWRSDEQVFQYSGSPGTGKTTVMLEMIRRFNVNPARIAPMAFVGAAAINMRMKGMTAARTIHSWLYDCIEKPVIENGKPKLDPYFNVPLMRRVFVPRDLDDIDLFVIDEAGTVPYNMLHDILSRGKKVIAAGDIDQLEPVGDHPAFLVDGKIHVLNQIMRQAEGSAIVYLCQRAKAGLPIHCGFYGDVWVIQKHEMTPAMMLNAGVILCGKNTTRDWVNKTVRQDLLGINSKFPVQGDKIICRKNNWTLDVGGINLTNGLTGYVVNPVGVSSYNGKTFEIDFQPFLISDIFPKVEVDYNYFMADYKQRKFLKENNYLKGNCFEYGYGQTVHTAQGSQWTHGIYLEEYLHKDMNSRLNYTALSRFQQQCIYVKEDSKYYGGI